MSKLTDNNILNALQEGKTVDLEGNILLRELLDGSEGVLYALYQEESLWKPYSPKIYELMQSTWTIKK
ncbi:MAG: hypothetical protein IKL90_05725 [Alphaproteobacteria bacterium]|nr:hypothetical protein [Alphaproteobacteria bacterium]